MPNKGRILVVDDEANARVALAELLRDEGYDVETAADAFKALGKFESMHPEVVLSDLKMPGMDGISLMRKLKKRRGGLPSFIVMTAFGAVDTAVEAMRAGAVDYLTKPINFDELVVVIERALERQRLLEQSVRLEELLAHKAATSGLVGESSALVEIRAQLEQLAKSTAPILIRGEKGTEKEALAREVHRSGDRADGPFIVFHGDGPEDDLEAVLFHSTGPLVGADGGTLLIDEVAALPMGAQLRLLDCLSTGSFECPDNGAVQVDVRFITTTGLDLENEVKEGRFRKELFYRLNVLSVSLPALRERTDDIALIAEAAARKHAKSNGKRIDSFREDALAALLAHPWPGNIVELDCAIERAVAMAHGPQITLQDLPISLRSSSPSDNPPTIPGSTLEEIERYAILKTLEACNGSTSKAAQVLGISVRKVQYKLHDYQEAPKSRAPVVEQSD